MCSSLPEQLSFQFRCSCRINKIVDCKFTYLITTSALFVGSTCYCHSHYALPFYFKNLFTVLSTTMSTFLFCNLFSKSPFPSWCSSIMGVGFTSAYSYVLWYSMIQYFVKILNAALWRNELDRTDRRKLSLQKWLLHFAWVVDDAKCAYRPILVTRVCVSASPRPHAHTTVRTRM